MIQDFAEQVDEIEYLNLIVSDVITPTDDFVCSFVDNFTLSNFWQKNKTLPKDLIYSTLPEVSTNNLSPTRKDEVLKFLKKKEILNKAYHYQEPDFSYLITQTKFSSITDIFDSVIADVPDLIETGFPTIDSAYNGGISKDSYNLILSQSNVGKTTVLLNLAANYAKKNLKVHFLTFEESLAAIVSRLTQNEISIGINDFRLMNDYQKDKFKISKVASNITVEAMPSSSLTVDGYVQRLEKSDFDILIIDYFTHFQKAPKVDVTSEYKRFSETLSSFATSSKKTIWSAAQATRDSYGKQPKLEDTGSSIASVQAANNVWSIMRGEATENEYALKLAIIKERQGVDTSRVFDFSISRKYQRLTDLGLSGQIPEKEPKKEKEQPVKFQSRDDRRKENLKGEKVV